MPTGDDCLTLQLHGHLDDVTLRVPSGHAGAAADEGLLRSAVQAWAARSRQSETELLADFATVRARRDALAAVLRRLRARLPRRLLRAAEAAAWRPAAALISGGDEAGFAARPSLSAAEAPPATLCVHAVALCVAGCNHMSWRLPPHSSDCHPTLCFQGDAAVPRPNGSAPGDGGRLLRRGADPVRPRGTILAMAILTMAILAVAILAMAILAMAILAMAANPVRPRGTLQLYAPTLRPCVSEAASVCSQAATPTFFRLQLYVSRVTSCMSAGALWRDGAQAALQPGMLKRPPWWCHSLPPRPPESHGFGSGFGCHSALRTFQLPSCSSF
jgi:hypothetical protein